MEELPESLSPPCQAPKLIVELWTLSAPDDSDGSSRITRRRVRQKSILAGTADPTASTGSGSGSSSASTASSSEEVSPSATVNETFSDTKIVGHNSCLSEEAESLFDVSEFITNGVTFGGMFHRIIEMSGENMLSVLYHRFLNTPGIMTYILTKQVRSRYFIDV